MGQGLGDLDPRHGLLGAAVDEKGAQRGVPPAAAGVLAGGMAGYGTDFLLRNY